jgi:hypothetical protein
MAKMLQMVPITVEMDVANRRVVLTYHRQPTIEEWKTVMAGVLARPELVPGFAIVLDRSAVCFPATTKYVREKIKFIDVAQQNSGPYRWAFVVGDLGSFGMGRMAEQITEFENTMHTFKSMRAADASLAGAS